MIRQTSGFLITKLSKPNLTKSRRKISVRILLKVVKWLRNPAPAYSPVPEISFRQYAKRRRALILTDEEKAELGERTGSGRVYSSIPRFAGIYQWRNTLVPLAQGCFPRELRIMPEVMERVEGVGSTAKNSTRERPGIGQNPALFGEIASQKANIF